MKLTIAFDNHDRIEFTQSDGGAAEMPVITRFFGIVIKMYFKEHGIAHFHAIYGEYNGVFEIESLEMMEGDLPVRAQQLIREWAEKYRRELLRMWDTQEYRQLPGLE